MRLLVCVVWVYGCYWFGECGCLLRFCFWVLDVFVVMIDLLVKVNSVGTLYSLILFFVLVYCRIDVGW